MVHLTKFLLPVVVKAQRVGWVGGGQAKCRNRFYYTIRAKIYAYAPPWGGRQWDRKTNKMFTVIDLLSNSVVVALTTSYTF